MSVLRGTVATVLLTFCLLAGLHGTAHAYTEQAVLTILPVQNVNVGDEVLVQVRLTTERGAPLYAQPLDVFLDGVYLETVETDLVGGARVALDPQLSVGEYTLEIVYAGYQFDVTEPASVTFTVFSVDVVVQTVPPIAELAFSFDGTEIVTGPDGIARLPVNSPGTYDLTLLPNPEVLGPRNATFVEWFPQNYSPSTRVQIPGETWHEVGFEQHYPVEFSFVDLSGEPVPSTRVTEMTLRASSGDVVTLSEFDEVLLPVNLILARLSGLDSTTVVHRVQEVIIDGSDVVNQGQQRFLYNPGRPVEIELLLYDVAFFAEDVFFGVPFGRNLELVFPDSSTKTFPIDAGNGLLLQSLARGDYEVRLETKGGVTFPLPLVLSRDQEVVIPVVSYIDLLLISGVTLGILFGLPLWGRRRKILALLFGKGDK